ncbi:MAG: hypothetical protein EBY17_01815 [Acidobacteriia bacterium]|nr:hypothetical protein [Terriglobia bacterium]
MKKHKVRFLKFGIVATVVPILLYGYPFGPDPRRTGAPGDAGTCLGSGCHTGTQLNSGGGSVKITAEDGSALTTYAPGLKQRIKVQLTDAAKGKFGFEFTARLASNLSNGQAGDFSTVDAFTQTICEDGSSKNNGATCPTRFPVQFIQHTQAGYQASTAGGYTFQFDWTPPGAGAGNVTLYVAGLGGPAGPATSSNANVYTTNVSLTPAAVVTGPSISSGGIVNSVTFGAGVPVAQGSLVAIYGSKLASSTAFASSVPLSTSLADTSVTIDGIAAPLTYVSDTQINAQIPWEALGGGTGSANVIVTSNGVKSATQTVTLGTASPGIYDASGHAIAINAQDPASARYGTISAPAGSIPGLTTFPAKVGDVLIVYGTGLGKLDSNPATGANSLDKLRTVVTTPVVLIGGQPAKVAFAGLSPQFVGVYQLNLVVPQVGAGSAVPIQIQIGGQTSPATTNIAVE